METMNTETKTLSLETVKALVLAVPAKTKFGVDRLVSHPTDIYGAPRTNRVRVQFNGDTWADVVATRAAVRAALIAAGYLTGPAKAYARSLGGCSGNVYGSNFQVGL